MTVRQMQDEIIRLKKEKKVCILAHTYQSHDILEIADYTGDSFGLSVKAQEDERQTILLCGVRFMAETAKMLSPQKTVILSHADAGCPMAEQMEKEFILRLKAEKGNIPVVAYINTTADLKTICDVCVTSSSAVRIVSKMPEPELIFIPDINLGSYVQSQVPEKTIHLVHGGCPVHARITAKEALKAKTDHPEALLLVHPECRPEVVALADMVGSTAEIIDFAAQSSAKSFIIGTENNIVSHLAYAHPNKAFHALSKDCVCHNMALTTLPEVLACLKGEAGEIIELPEDTIRQGVKCIERMLLLGN